MKKILIGIDDSKFAEYATEYGFGLARKLNAEVGLVHIVEPVATAPVNINDTGIGFNIDPAMDVISIDLMHIQDEQAKLMLTAAIKTHGEGMQITTFSEFGNTADGIISCSVTFNADMIVIGTHSRTGLDRFFMGSVAEHVVRHSLIPVLVVPMKEEVVTE